METGDLRTAIYEHLPGLDEILEIEDCRYHERIFRAAYLFVELAVEAPEPTKQKMIASALFREASFRS